MGAGSASARSPGGVPVGARFRRGWPRRASGDPGAAERRPLPSPAQRGAGRRGAQGPRASESSAAPEVRDLRAGRRVRTPPQSADCWPSPPPARESPHWSCCWGRRGGWGGSGRRGSCSGLSSLAKLPHAGLRGPKGFLSSGSPFFFFLLLVLFVRGRPTPPAPRPSPLPPHVGTAPLGQAFFLSSSSSCLEEAPIFFLFFHLRDILITSLLQR